MTYRGLQSGEALSAVALVDRATAARILCVSIRTLDRWHRLRIGPPRIALRRQIRYRIEAIHTWITMHEDAVA